MLKNISILTMSIFLLVSQRAGFATIPINHPPTEAIVLKLSTREYAKWREVYRLVEEKQGMVQCVSRNSLNEKEVDVICIEFRHQEVLDKKIANSIEKIVERNRETLYSDLKGNNLQWKIIEKHPNDIIYEWRLSKPCNNALPQHQIARSFLTDTGWHQIVISHMNSEMSVADREKWINTLKESASVVPYEEAAKTLEALSMADQVKNALVLRDTFHSWKAVSTYYSDTGYTLVCYTPPGHSEIFITECLELTTMPNLDDVSLDKAFEIEKKVVSNNSPTTIDFHILKKTPTEIIYSYSIPKNLLHLTAVVRTFITGRGYYSISYKRGLDKKMKEREILQSKDRLEMIKVCEGF